MEILELAWNCTGGCIGLGLRCTGACVGFSLKRFLNVQPEEVRGRGGARGPACRRMARMVRKRCAPLTPCRPAPHAHADCARDLFIRHHVQRECRGRVPCQVEGFFWLALTMHAAPASNCSSSQASSSCCPCAMRQRLPLVSCTRTCWWVVGVHVMLAPEASSYSSIRLPSVILTGIERLTAGHCIAARVLFSYRNGRAA